MELLGPPKTGFPSLYNYQRFKADWLTQTVVGKRLHFSNPGRFNDPWDCQPHFNSDAVFDPSLHEKHVQYYIRITRAHGVDGAAIPEEEIQRLAAEFRANPNYLKSKIDEFSADFHKQINRCWRVYCVSTHPNSELMWAHYADSHKGICLEFCSRSPLFFQALKVSYLRNYPVFDMAEEDANNALTVLLTKSRAWKYEDEYRLISLEKDCVRQGASVPRLITDNGLLDLPDNSLRAVILGWLAPESTVTAVKALIAAASYPIALKRIIKVPNQYRLMVKEAS